MVPQTKTYETVQAHILTKYNLLLGLAYYEKKTLTWKQRQCQDAATKAVTLHHSFDRKQQDGHVNNRLTLHGCNEASTTMHKLQDDGCCFDRPAFPTWQCPWT